MDVLTDMYLMTYKSALKYSSNVFDMLVNDEQAGKQTDRQDNTENIIGLFCHAREGRQKKDDRKAPSRLPSKIIYKSWFLEALFIAAKTMWRKEWGKERVIVKTLLDHGKDDIQRSQSFPED